jgi:colanic acid/amylovoran biosynthesis glycosyltransferase
MKIGLVLPALPAYSETFFRTKIQGLIDEGHQVVLFVIGNQKVTEIYGAKVQGLYVNKSSSLSQPFFIISEFLTVLIGSFPKAITLFQKNYKTHSCLITALKSILLNGRFLKYDLDWLHFGFGTLVINREHVAEVLGARMAVSFRGFDYYVFPLKNPSVYKTLFQKNPRIHVLSMDMKKGLMQQGMPEHSIYVIPPAIQTTFAEVITVETPITSTDKLKLLTVSRLHWIKGIEYLLMALAQLKKTINSVELTIIGDGAERERLVCIAHQLGLESNVIWLGKQSSDMILQHMKETNIYIQYSIEEGFCNAVLEAQAVGCLCIVSDAHGLLENIEEGLTGWITSKRSPQLLAETIEHVYRLPESTQKIFKSKAQKRIQEKFTLSAQKIKFQTFYTDK